MHLGCVDLTNNTFVFVMRNLGCHNISCSFIPYHVAVQSFISCRATKTRTPTPNQFDFNNVLWLLT